MDKVFLAAAFITTISFVLMCGTLVSLVRSRARLRRFVRVPGVVVDVRAQSSMDTGSSTQTYAPVLAFRTVEGRDVETESARSSNLYAGKTGQHVSVIYDPVDPTEAYIGSATGTPVFVYLIGLLITAGVFLVGATVLLHRIS